ncbi:hypothetical protein [Hirschia litorea]|uniref:Uncharacterized protein n=1 Tax=Hirschia litorea TaxID=1199156 RepID=A0ABW2IH34_9PROT
MTTPRQMDAFLIGWERALRGVQMCLAASFDTLEIRYAIEQSLGYLCDALELAEAQCFSNLEEHNVYDLTLPETFTTLSPLLREALARRIEHVASSATRDTLKERIKNAATSSCDLIEEGAISSRFLAHILALAAGNCILEGEPTKIRERRKVHPLTAKLIVLNALEHALENDFVSEECTL